MTTDDARKDFPMILERDWEALGYLERPRGSWDLNGEIHDIFQYNLEGRATPIWEKHTRAQYGTLREAMKPVFRLATNLLLCPASLDWFYYLVYAPRKRTDPLVQEKGDDVFEYRRDDTTMEKRHEMARAALKRFALTHTFEFEDFENGHDDEGRTRPRLPFSYAPQGVNIKDDSPTTVSGIGSEISISRPLVKQLMEMVTEDSQSEDRKFTLVTKLAVTIVHEIAVSRLLVHCNTRAGYSAYPYHAQGILLNMALFHCSPDLQPTWLPYYQMLT